MATRKQQITPGNRDKRISTIKPVKEMSELSGFWDRAFELENGYRELVVEVIGRDNNTLFFFVLDEDGNRRKTLGAQELSINLDDGMTCWSSLPSTAPQVDPESAQRIGYLFVTDAWIKENLGPIKVFGGGVKWPKNTSL